MFVYLIIFVMHCTWVTSNAYSSPSVVLASSMPDGSQHIIDDYREAYQWLDRTPKKMRRLCLGGTTATRSVAWLTSYVRG